MKWVYLLLFISSGICDAKEYFGFNLGMATVEQVVSTLKSAGASYQEVDANAAFRGQHLIKITSYSRMSKYDAVHTAVLMFNRERILYAMDLSWQDNEATVFEALNESMDKKYKLISNEISQVGRVTIYSDNGTEIRLVNSLFSLMYGNYPTMITYILPHEMAKIEFINQQESNEAKKRAITKSASDI
jgi:hypothetical protein